MTVDLLRPRGKTCHNCKHISEDSYSPQVLMDFGFKGGYWKCMFRSYYDGDEVFPREIIVYTDGSNLCSGWEPKDKKR